MWLSMAAVLLALSLFGVWFYAGQSKVDEQVAVTKKGQGPKTGPSLKPLSPVTQQPDSSPIGGSDVGPTAPEVNAPQQLATHKNAVGTDALDHTAITDHRSVPFVATPRVKDKLARSQNNSVERSSAQDLKIEGQSNVAGITTSARNSIAQAPNNKRPSVPPAVADSSNLNDRAGTFAANAATSRTEKTASIMAKTADSANVDKGSRMERFLAAEQKKEDAKRTKVDKDNAQKRVLYSIYAGTFFNYAEGSKSQVNAGAGFSTDIKLAGNLKLSTGIAIARNSLSYNGRPTSAGILNDAVGASRSSAADASYAAAPNGLANTSLGVVAFRVVPSPSVSAYNVALTGLDVPINLKYELDRKHSDAFISAGISSGTFINETFNYSYENSANTLGSSASIPDATTRKSFANFDLARTLNVSVGMGYQITKSNRLVIEPFLKYPLSGMGSQQIKFGSGGINLRLKFQTGKK
jgi:hypothetical protein